jgi:UDP-N-acetylglucosamine 4,6-dehydratase/5-epimerase
MITRSDAYYTKDIGKMYVILPADFENKKSLRKKYGDYKNVPVGFSYNSGENTNFLSIEQLKNLIALNC